MTEVEAIKQFMDETGVQVDSIDGEKGSYYVTFHPISEAPSNTLKRMLRRARAYHLEVRPVGIADTFERVTVRFE